MIHVWAVWPFEAMILTKKAQKNISSLTKEEGIQFAEAISVLTKAYDKLFDCSFPYSSGIHQAPTNKKANSHWTLYMRFYPPLIRISTVTIFRVGYEMFSCPQRDKTAKKEAKLKQDLV